MATGSDFLYALVICVFIGVVAVALIYTSQQVNLVLAIIPGYNAVPQCGSSATGFNNCFNQSISPLNATTSVSANYVAFDTWFPFIFFLISIAIILAAALVPQSPLAISITFIMMIVVVILAFVISNALIPYFTNPLFANAVILIPHTLFIYANLGLEELLFFFVYIIVIAARSRSPGGGGGGGVAYGLS